MARVRVLSEVTPEVQGSLRSAWDSKAPTIQRLLHTAQSLPGFVELPQRSL